MLIKIKKIQCIIDDKKHLSGTLLPILHEIQHHYGYIPKQSLPLLAQALQQTEAEIYGVISFYRHFRLEQTGKHLVEICRGEACQAMGAKQLEQAVKQQLGIDYQQTTQDKSITLAPVYCLGNCACAPSVKVADNVYGRMNADKFSRLTNQLSSDAISVDEAKGENRLMGKSMILNVYIPRDTTALAMGANEVVKILESRTKPCHLPKNKKLNIIRNGSRGLFYLEPLIEVETAQGRVAYGPIGVDDVASLLEQGMLHGKKDHPLYLGLTENIPYLAHQQRLTFTRVGIIDPLSIEDYIEHHGFKGLTTALTLSKQQIVSQVKESGLRGRGGAAFPTGIKWQTVLNEKSNEKSNENIDQQAVQKYIVCNADEGDSGTFADRLLMEADPFSLIEGMIIAGIAVGATQGFIYLRSEYPQAKIIVEHAIALAYQNNYLGENIQGSGKYFNIELRLGAGAYICGEETSLLESLEGKRGLVRAKPPLPAIAGLFGKPTVVNNVITLATVPIILAKGQKYYQDFGLGRSRGTLPFQLAGNIKQGGLVELAFGTSLHELVYQFGGGSHSGKPIKAIQVGGPLGAYLPEQQWQTALDYEAFTNIDAVLGHGGVVVFDDSVDMAQQARFAMEFCVEESCGKCTPCRIGSVRGVETIDKIIAGDEAMNNLELLTDLCDTMVDGSLCAMGGMTPFPVRSVIKHFKIDLLSTSSRGENNDQLF